MKATPDIDEALIEAIVRGDPVPEAYEPSGTFRGAGCSPALPSTFRCGEIGRWT
jgi:hypothetical protein